MDKEIEFNYDLKRMKKMVENETIYLPKDLKDSGDIRKWLLEQSNKLSNC